MAIIPFFKKIFMRPSSLQLGLNAKFLRTLKILEFRKIFLLVPINALANPIRVHAHAVFSSKCEKNI